MDDQGQSPTNRGLTRWLGLFLIWTVLTAGLLLSLMRSSPVIADEGQPTAGTSQTAVNPDLGPCAEGGGWFLCDLIDKLGDGIEKIESLIYQLLEVDPDKYNSCDVGQGAECPYKTAWRQLRNLSFFVIVGTALFMVIATAVDAGIFAKYTVKKYIARLVVGAVLVQLSWILGDLLIQVFNGFGSFIGEVITGPFTKTGTTPASQIGLADIFQSAGGQATFGAGVGLALVAGVGSVGLAPILMLALTGFLMIVVGFGFLILREFIIIALLISSPIGLAAWFAPGDDKYWRLYLRSFLGLVAIYPVIVGVIALSRAFVWVLINNNTGGVTDWLVIIIAFLVYLAGFAAIPVLFKRFASVINQITGGSNNPAKGLIDRVKQRRQSMATARKEDRRTVKDASYRRNQAGGSRFDRVMAKMGTMRRRFDRGQGPFLPPGGAKLPPWTTASKMRQHTLNREQLEREAAVEKVAEDQIKAWQASTKPLEKATLQQAMQSDNPGQVRAGLRKIMDFKDGKSFIDAKQSTNPLLAAEVNRAYSSGKAFEAFKQTDPDIAFNRTGQDDKGNFNFDFTKLDRDKVLKMSPAALERYRHQVKTQIANRVVHQSDQPPAEGHQQPLSQEQVNRIKDSLGVINQYPEAFSVMPDNKVIINEILQEVNYQPPPRADNRPPGSGPAGPGPVGPSAPAGGAGPAPRSPDGRQFKQGPGGVFIPDK